MSSLHILNICWMGLDDNYRGFKEHLALVFAVSACFICLFVCFCTEIKSSIKTTQREYYSQSIASLLAKVFNNEFAMN